MFDDDIFESIDNFWLVSNKKIGSGGFSDVLLMYYVKNPNLIFAVKKLIKKEEEIFYIKKEIELHKSLKHENII